MESKKFNLPIHKEGQSVEDWRKEVLEELEKILKVSKEKECYSIDAVSRGNECFIGLPK